MTQAKVTDAPKKFCEFLTKKAREANKRIVLPEGNEPRTVKAANICAEEGIATPVLLGKREEIEKVAKSLDFALSGKIEIIDPDKIRENYVARLVELRKSKGLTEEDARKLLEDNVYLGTMMIERNEVDGLVSGAVHTTANTIRPALQVIKTAPGQSIVAIMRILFPPYFSCLCLIRFWFTVTVQSILNQHLKNLHRLPFSLQTQQKLSVWILRLP